MNINSRAAYLTNVHLSHLQVLLKLFSYCVKVKINRQQLVKPEMNTLNVMLGTLNLVSDCLTWEEGALHFSQINQVLSQFISYLN